MKTMAWIVAQLYHISRCFSRCGRNFSRCNVGAPAKLATSAWLLPCHGVNFVNYWHFLDGKLYMYNNGFH